MFKDALWIDFLKPQVERTFQSRSEVLYEMLAANKNIKQKQVVIDEVQKVPQVLRKVLSLPQEYRDKKQMNAQYYTSSQFRQITKSFHPRRSRALAA